MHTSLRSRYCPLPGSRRRSRVWVAGQSRKSTPWYGIGLNASKGLNRRCRVLQDPPSRVPRPPKSNGNTTGHGLMRAHSRLCFGSASPLAPDRPSEPQRVVKASNHGVRNECWRVRRRQDSPPFHPRQQDQSL
jgi:hypothetical protein